MIKAEKIKITSDGLRLPDNGKTGKEGKFVPWSHIKKTNVSKCIKMYEGSNRDVDFTIYYVEKAIKGNKMQATFNTKREALIAIDMFLIKNNMPPENILKKI
jgi:hypothetical protein